MATLKRGNDPQRECVGLYRSGRSSGKVALPRSYAMFRIGETFIQNTRFDSYVSGGVEQKSE